MAYKVSVEVPLFFTYFGFLLADSVNTNLLIYRTCYVTLGFDKHNCSLLGNVDNNITRQLEELVQPKADMIAMTKTLVDSISGAILCLLVGAWSDRFGRKPILVLNITGFILMNLVMVGYSLWESLSPWLMMTCSIPVILTGGGGSLTTILLAYLTDITSEEERGFRMGIFEITTAVSVFAGTSASSYVFNATGYAVVYSIAAAGCVLALVYTVAFLTESVEIRETNHRINGLFQIQNLSDMFRTSFRRRPLFHRAIIMLVMLTLALYFVVINGDASVMFLYMRRQFDWTLQQFTLYSSMCSILWIVATFLVVYVVHHRWHVGESKIILAGFLSMVVAPLLVGLARVDWLIYAAAGVRIPSGGISPMSRSLVSKLVASDEAGKIFSVFSLIQGIIGLVGSPLYTNLYNKTIDTNPGMFNFLSSSVYVVNTFCILLVLVLQKRGRDDDNYSALQTESAFSENTNHTQNIDAVNNQPEL